MKRRKKGNDQPELDFNASQPPPPPSKPPTPPGPPDPPPPDPPPDPSDGRKARDEGMELVEGHTPESYKAKFWAEIILLAAIPKPFQVDELRAQIGDPPNHPNAFSSLIGAAVKKKIIRRFHNEEIQSTRNSSHARWLRYYIGTQHDL